MTLPAALASVPSNPPKVGVGVAALLAFAPLFAFSFWTGFGSLISALILLWATAYKEERQLAMKCQSEERQLAMKLENADKERKHKAREGDKDRKKDIALALIGAGGHKAPSMTLAA